MDKNKKIENLNIWLCEFQEDLNKIVSKYKYSSHVLSREDLISEINIALLKEFDKFCLDGDKQVTDQATFKKVAYCYARNYISWTSKGTTAKDKKYRSNRVDGVDAEGNSVFDSVSILEGKEDDFFINLYKSDKFKNIISWIFDYSDFLTPHQKNVLELSLAGKNLIEISKLLNVSHQAVQSLLSGVTEEIKSHILVTLNHENSDSAIIEKGHKSIKSLFGADRLKPSISNSDGLVLRKRLSDKPKKYSLNDLSNFFGNKYKVSQISAFVNRNKYSHLLNKKTLKTN